MFNFTITTAELIGWIIIYIVGLICVALGLGCVIHGERQKRFQLQQQLDYMIEAIGTLEQRVIDLESHAMWIDESDHSKPSVFPNEHLQLHFLRYDAGSVAEDGTLVIDGEPITDAIVGTVAVVGRQTYVYNGTSWGTIDSLGWDKISAAGTSCQSPSPTKIGDATKVITPPKNDHS